MKKFNIIKCLAPIIIILFISGCAFEGGYNPNYIPFSAPQMGLQGKALIVVDAKTAQNLYTGSPTSFTGSATTLTLPLGKICTSIAYVVFNAAYQGGADYKDTDAGSQGYTVIIRPQITNFTYQYNQAKNLGFAITPQIDVSLHVEVRSQDGKLVSDKNYTSGLTDGATYAMSGQPAEKINQILHVTLFRMLCEAAADVRKVTSVTLNPQPQVTNSGSQYKESGTGVIISKSGYVLTAAHVIANSSKLMAVTIDGLKSARVVSVDESNDIALLKLEKGDYTSLEITSSRNVRLGQSVSTIGFPNPYLQGFSPKVTKGEISSMNGIIDDPRSWQISVPVQPGNSGGPLLNDDGKLVGLVESKLGLRAAQVTNDLPQNVGYAVKSAYLIPLIESLKDVSIDSNIPVTNKESFEDMVARCEKATVMILNY